MPVGIKQVTHDQQGNTFWAGNALYNQATQSQAAGATAITIADLLAGASQYDTSALVGAKMLTIVVYNNATAQTVTGLSLATSGQTTSGGTGTITYPITSDVAGNAVSIAPGATQTFLVPLTKGHLRTFVLTPTFGAAPAAGSIDTVTAVHGSSSSNGQVSLAGSNTMVGHVVNITTTNTAQQLANVACNMVTVIAKKGNTGTVYIGGSGVTNADYAVALDPKDAQDFAITNLDQLYIYGTSGDGVSYVAV